MEDKMGWSYSTHRIDEMAVHNFCSEKLEDKSQLVISLWKDNVARSSGKN
jgi:hypothetical protein